MFDRIEAVDESYILVKLKEGQQLKSDILNVYVAILDTEKALLGEIEELKDGKVNIKMLGEVKNGIFYAGILRKPLLDAQIRPLMREELPLLLGVNERNSFLLGESPYYQNLPVYADINRFFCGHFAIFGNSGSGKSCGLARLMQNLFQNQTVLPYKSNFILFDISGEYSSAFRNLNTLNPNYNYRVFTTNKSSGYGEPLRIPIWLLDKEDIALLLMCHRHSQIPIIERMLKLTKIFAESTDESNNIKNHLIAKAMMSILYSNQTAANKRNDIFSIINTCSTEQFNLDAVVQGIGYTRKFRECFLIDKSGEFSESILITEYISGFINEQYDNYEPTKEYKYSLSDMEKALNFALISEGWYKNEESYVDSITIKVRLHSLITGKYHDIFDYDNYVNLEQYLSDILISNNKRHQLININLDDIDDSMAKVITKLFTKFSFEFCKKLQVRGSVPFHILIDEAHRYIQNDNDQFLIGYNIFERVAKEGRKYGVLMGIITQRPVELSDTVISQVSNFLIFKTNHPRDMEYIKQMIPNINADIIDKQKTLQSGTCLGFGNAFKIPLMIKFKLPDPMINAENCDVIKNWGN